MPVILTKGHTDARPFRHVADLSPFLTTDARDHAARAADRETVTMWHRLQLGISDTNPYRAGDDLFSGSSFAMANRENGRRMAGIVAGPVAW